MKLKNLKIYLLAIFAIFLFGLQTTAMFPHSKLDKSQSEISNNKLINLGDIMVDLSQLWNILYNDNDNHKTLRTILNSSNSHPKLTNLSVTKVSKFEFTKNRSHKCAYDVKIEITSTTTKENQSTHCFTVTLIAKQNNMKLCTHPLITLSVSDAAKHFFLHCYSEKKPNPTDYTQAINKVISRDNLDFLDITHDTNAKYFEIYTTLHNKNELHIFTIKYSDNIESDTTLVNLLTTNINKQATFSTNPILFACMRLHEDYYSTKEIQEKLNFYKSPKSTEKEHSDENDISNSDSENQFLTQRCKKEKRKKHRKYKKRKEHSDEKERKSSEENDTSSSDSSRSFFSLSSDNSSNVFIQQMPTVAFDISINTLPTEWLNSNIKSAKEYFLNIIKNNVKLEPDQQLLLGAMIANLDNVNMNYESSVLSINPSPSIKQLVSFTIGSQNPTRLFGSFNYKACKIDLNTNQFSPSAKSNFQKFLSRGLQHSKQNDDVHASIKKPDQNTPQTYVTLSNNIINIIINIAQTNGIMIKDNTNDILKIPNNITVNYVQQTGNDYLIWISNTKTNAHYIFVINFPNDQINQN